MRIDVTGLFCGGFVRPHQHTGRDGRLASGILSSTDEIARVSLGSAPNLI